MNRTLQRHWFLCGLSAAIVGGVLLGRSSGDPLGTIEPLFERYHLSTVAIAAILFLMAVTLKGDRLLAALRAPGPVLWAIIVNIGLIPILGIGLSRLQLTADYSVGLMIAASVPCTMAAVSVWTRKAGGNDAVSLLVTFVTNGGCFLFTPLWLRWGTAADVQLDTAQMVQRLILSALLPCAVGQLCRLWAPIAEIADRGKTQIGVIAQAGILLLVLRASANAGSRLDLTDQQIGIAATLWVWGCCLAIHMIALAVAYGGARALRFETSDTIACAFAGSQKTLPIGILVATDPTMFGSAGVPLAVFPMLMYHASQLFFDTAIIGRFPRVDDPPVSP